MSKGLDFERTVVAYYQNLGYASSRFAGSKGFHNYKKDENGNAIQNGIVDVIAVREHKAFPEKLYYFISCKNTLLKFKSLSEKDKLEFYNFSVKYGAIPVIAIKVRKTKEFPEGIAFDYLLDVRVKNYLPFVSNEDSLTILKQKGQQIESLFVRDNGKHKEIKLNA